MNGEKPILLKSSGITTDYFVRSSIYLPGMSSRQLLSSWFITVARGPAD